ncbi:MULTISPECIES: SusC/RagA family TonB-linked outer membrane protein [Butyricimonas]|uniref:SusC/RagA family TonB-linked outer membrane protein n=1 Tax=Butyricimonas TaxID=574697 RepID=UPI001D087EBF|nr:MULTISPECIES: SusC/RagA family TonB-linked outer membrane protein [Butyricimonas]MCB6974693.1 SusC/RagA family TonB-linked outer membrane protein [Butyricimonas synergistica]MCG4521453.1 SusC/RagA family TonB-linked outer membrane protein [Butyricimonas sp. DFI.6.44]
MRVDFGYPFMNMQVYGQEKTKRISLKVANVSVLQALHEVNRLCGNWVMFRTEEVVKEKGRVTVDVKNKSVLEVVKECLKGTALGCVEKDGKIIVTVEGVKILRITGLVTDGKAPLPGATVLVKGLTMGTVTDAKGRYVLSLPMMEKLTLLFSFMGMETREVVYAGKDTINVVLREDVKQMSEVVVTGYGSVSKGNYTGASTTVRAEDIMMAGATSVDQMLQGVVPGMLVRNSTGQVGATPKVRVRGTSTLLGSQEPVWVVDGVIQRDPQPFNLEDNMKFSVDADDIKQLAGNAISWLNPNDIETITVLKDASATAIYGSKAANGVIVITTKKATIGKLQVNYSGDFSIGQRPHYGLYDLMNSAERMELSRDIYMERRNFNAADIVLPIGYEGLLKRYLDKEISLKEMDTEYQKMSRQNTDWFKILFRNSFNHNHSLSISGGSEKLQNRTSFGYSRQLGDAKGNNLSQFTVVSNTTVQLWNQLTVNMTVNGSTRKVDGFAYGVDPFSYAYATSRVIPCYEEDGSLFYHEKSGRGSEAIRDKTVYNYNILNEKMHTGSSNYIRTWGTVFDLRWRIFEDIEYQGMFSYSSSSSDTKKYASERSHYISEIRGYEYGTVAPNSVEVTSTPLPMGGLLETDLTNVSTIATRNSLMYNKLLNFKHQISVQVGIETNSAKTKGETNVRWGYMPDRGETFAIPPTVYYLYGSTSRNNVDKVSGKHSVLNRIENTLSEYAMAVYSYDDRYVVNLSGRFDASNRFGQDKNKRLQPTWSAGVKWRVVNEHFLGKHWWLNNLDLYGSFGYQGNAVSSVSPELITTDVYEYLYNSYGLEIVSLPYPDLGWEKTKTWNVGIDAAFLNGRVNFNFNWFKKISDVLSSKGVALENGVANGIVSGSTMENSGYDFVINVVPVRRKDFTWQLSLNTSVTKNKVTKNNRVNLLDDYLNGNCIVDGEPFSTFYSYVFDELEQEYGRPRFKYMDLESVNDIKDFMVKSGKFTPDFSGGLNTMFKYKNLTLYALFAVQWGGHNRLPNLYEATMARDGLPLPHQNVSKKLLNRWKKTGDNTSIPSLPGINSYGDYILFPTNSVLMVNYKSRESSYVMYNQSDLRVANTDFIRCRSLSLAYNFGEKTLSQIGLSYLQLKLSMTNPFMWVSDKKWDGLDPETGNWPTRRVTSFSVQVMF